MSTATLAVQGRSGSRAWVAWAALSCLLLLTACQRTQTVQHGYRGQAAVQLYETKKLAAAAELNSIPPPEEEADQDSPLASEVFKNVKVLGDVKATEFSRLMQALSTWVAPEQGCDFCHNPKKLASDEKYPKVVARRMLQMTRQINTDWKQHVGNTGVTCWTCHRGQAVPSGDWFSAPVAVGGPRMVGAPVGQNHPTPVAAGSSLPTDPLSTFLISDANLRVQGTVPLAGDNRHSIKQAEWTYSMMIYMSNSLGVNCTYCHNSRALSRWEQSTPQRATAWHGLRMVRSLNTDYLIPLTPLLPVNRLSPQGDGPKVGCATCHKGAFKPLYGVSSLVDYPILAGVMPAAASAPAAAAPPPSPAPAPPVGAKDAKAVAVKVALQK
jgi:photosynthetic reaction center cytochrome c subunit